MKTLKSFEFKESGRGFSKKYNWDKILDGGLYKLEEGTDFTAKIDNMVMMVKEKAKKRGLLVKVNKVDGGVVLQVVGKDPNYVKPAPKPAKAAKTPPAAPAA